MNISDTDVILGLDVGGTKMRVVAVAAEQSTTIGAVVYEKTVSTNASRNQPLIHRIVALISDVLDELSLNYRVRAIGVGSAGVIDHGRVVEATSLLPGWKGTNIEGVLSSRFAVPVTALNDVHAAAICESKFGAGAGYGIVLHVMVGTGIGGAVTVNGELQRGATGACGSIGHMPSRFTTYARCTCGGIDHIEAHASGSGIEREYAEAAHLATPLRVKEIARLAADGDKTAHAFLETRFVALGEVLGGAVNLIDPDIVILGGGVANLGERFMVPVNAGLRSSVLPSQHEIPVVRASDNDRQVSIGAAIAVRKIVLAT